MSNLKTEYAELPDIRIAFTQSGSGRTLILLHGNSESKGIFRQYQLKHFPMLTTIAIDSRGHGESRSTDNVYTIHQFSEDVINFCQIKGIKDAYVIGYSDGGNIALLLAKKVPELFSRIIAISPNYLVSGTTDAALRSLKLSYKLLSFLNRIGFDTKKTLMRFDLMLEDIGITNDELKSIQTQLKIIYAEHDMIKETHLKKLAELIPNSSLDMIDGYNHLTILNNLKTIEIIKNYLLELKRTHSIERNIT